jgi:hypothetical protein
MLWTVERAECRADRTVEEIIGPHLQAFFAEHLLNHKRASPQTIACYRDTFRLLLRFMHLRLPFLRKNAITSHLQK